MTAILKSNSNKDKLCSSKVSKTFGLHFFSCPRVWRFSSVRTPMWAILLTMLIGMAACKPTEKNYRSAYDVALEKREREKREGEERRREMGLEDGAILQDADGVRRISVGEREVLSRNLNFARADSVKTYAVSVGTFRMPGNAKAMAADLDAEGFPGTRALKSGDNYFIVIGSGEDASEGVELMDRFSASKPDWQYVGQPGILMVIGGSR